MAAIAPQRRSEEGAEGQRSLGALKQAFHTPIWAADIGEAVDNAALLAGIEEVRQSDRSFRFWHYPRGYTSFYSGLALWDQPAFAPIVTAILQQSRAYLEAVGLLPDKPKRLRLTDLFCTVGQKYSHHPRHNHGEVELSGVYYVAVPKNSAPLSFSSPIEPLLMGSDIGAFEDDSPWISVYHHETPLPGRMLLFPSWLLHEVDLHRKTEPRVTVGFNLCLETPRSIPDDELPSSDLF